MDGYLDGVRIDFLFVAWLLANSIRGGARWKFFWHFWKTSSDERFSARVAGFDHGDFGDLQLFRFDVGDRLLVDHANHRAIWRADDWFDAIAKNKIGNGPTVSHAVISPALCSGAGGLGVCVFHLRREDAGLWIGDAGAGVGCVFDVVGNA